MSSGILFLKIKYFPARDRNGNDSNGTIGHIIGSCQSESQTVWLGHLLLVEMYTGVGGYFHMKMQHKPSSRL